jgi:hypothetical protein
MRVLSKVVDKLIYKIIRALQLHSDKLIVIGSKEQGYTIKPKDENDVKENHCRIRYYSSQIVIDYHKCKKLYEFLEDYMEDEI